MRRVANPDLRLEDVPPPGSDWDEIERLALTYDCYQHPDCADIANSRRNNSLDDLRTCLSFEQRRWRHFDEVPDGDDLAYIWSLVEQIRAHVRANSATIMAPGTFIFDLGEDLVTCACGCAGVAQDTARGVLPRCMVFRDRPEVDSGCIVVGLNPGRCPQGERDFYVERGCTYQSVVDFWEAASGRIKYNTLINKFLEAAGLQGSVLWTELAKCESAAGAPTIPPIQTLRRCGGRYLARELAVMPAGWPVIGVGADAFKALAFLEPNRVVLGLPHPTGSRGHFARLFEGDALRPAVAARISALLGAGEPVAHWLG